MNAATAFRAALVLTFLTGIAQRMPAQESRRSQRPAGFDPSWQPASHTTTREGYRSTNDPSDLGHGVVFPRPRNDGTLPLADTILFHAAPYVAAKTVGALVTRVIDSTGSSSRQIWAPERLTPNLVEFTYEEDGVPFDSVDRSRRWRRAILGFTTDRTPFTGWVLVTSAVGDTTWRTMFHETTLRFLTEGAAFHEAPSGRVVATATALAARGGFDMTSVELRGGWMRMKVEHPGMACNLDVSTKRTTDYWWVRAFDARGRPLVFVFPRGC